MAQELRADFASDLRLGHRSMLRGSRAAATDEEDPTVDPKYDPVGRQRIEDTGALTIERMETVDDEVTDAAEAFIRTAVGAAGAWPRNLPVESCTLLPGHEALVPAPT